MRREGFSKNDTGPDDGQDLLGDDVLNEDQTKQQTEKQAEEKAELLALGRISHAMRSYERASRLRRRGGRGRLARLSERHREILESLRSQTVYSKECRHILTRLCTQWHVLGGGA
jgi:hypothetical protein